MAVLSAVVAARRQHARRIQPLNAPDATRGNLRCLSPHACKRVPCGSAQDWRARV